MTLPDSLENCALARSDAALQRRRHGPHPLADFLALAAETCGSDRARLKRVLAGVRAYQNHAHVRIVPLPPVIAASGSARVLDYGGSGPIVLVVPSLINPPTVLDLSPDNSLLRWLAVNGVHPLLVDWGGIAAETGFSIDDYVTQRLLPLVDAVRPTALAGYCLGGTMAAAAASRCNVRRLALIAAPWRFGGYGEVARARIDTWWQSVEPAASALGAVPMELLQPMFWRLDPRANVAKFERIAVLSADDPELTAFAALEDWANDGPPLSLPAARQLCESFFRDDTPGRGLWTTVPDIPVADFVATRDRIVPTGAAMAKSPPVCIDAGHVGMIVGTRARTQLWEPLRGFLVT